MLLQLHCISSTPIIFVLRYRKREDWRKGYPGEMYACEKKHKHDVKWFHDEESQLKVDTWFENLEGAYRE